MLLISTGRKLIERVTFQPFRDDSIDCILLLISTTSTHRDTKEEKYFQFSRPAENSKLQYCTSLKLKLRLLYASTSTMHYCT